MFRHDAVNKLLHCYAVQNYCCILLPPILSLLLSCYISAGDIVMPFAPIILGRIAMQI